MGRESLKIQVVERIKTKDICSISSMLDGNVVCSLLRDQARRNSDGLTSEVRGIVGTAAGHGREHMINTFTNGLDSVIRTKVFSMRVVGLEDMMDAVQLTED